MPTPGTFPRTLVWGLLGCAAIWLCIWVAFAEREPEPVVSPLQDFGAYLIRQPSLEEGAELELDVHDPELGRTRVRLLVVEVKPLGQDCPVGEHSHE